jgi:hypothetical protein
VLDRDFIYEDQEVLEEFKKIAKLASSRGDVEEIDVYELATTMAGSHLVDIGSSAGEELLAARRYRMIVQWYGSKLGVDGDVLKDVQSVHARAQQWCEA